MEVPQNGGFIHVYIVKSQNTRDDLGGTPMT